MTEQIDVLLVIMRCVEFAAAFGLFGFAAFQFYAPPDLRRTAGPLYRIILPVLACAAAIGWSVAIARQIGGGIDASTSTLLGRILLTTGFGRALLIAALLTAGLTLAGLLNAERRLALLVSSAALLVALAFVGHAAGNGLAGGVRITVQSVHLLAAAAWLGGLPPLALAIRRDSPPVAVLLRRFGRMGVIAVVLVLATGVGSIIFVIGIAGGHLGPIYIRVLALKLTLVLVLFAMAAVNRFRLTPMAAHHSPEALAALRRTILLEQVLALGIVASVATLGQLDPTM